MRSILLSLVAATVASGQPLPRATPESQGISSTAIQKLVDEFESRQLGLHSLIIVRHGRVIAEGWWAPYAPEEPHMLFSLSKSFTSTAIGLLQAEGKLSIDDPVVKFFPDDLPADASANLRAMRVRDLLRMTTGQHQADVQKIPLMGPNADRDPVKAFLATPVPHKPGTHWFYNSHATFILSVIAQKVSGQTLRDYLVPRLFAPLGILTPDWDATAGGYSFGASGLHLRTEDIAKFGQLYLQRGEWQGRRLIPAAWIEEATAAQTANGSNPDSDWDQGYGYQFWRCVPGFYRADGAMGQYCIVMPQHDTVVAINSGTRDMGAIMKVLWSALLPELRPGPLPENTAASAALRARLAALAQPLVEGAAHSPVAAQVTGRRYVISPADNPAGIESLVLTAPTEGRPEITLRMRGQDLTLPIGHGTWLKSTAPWGPAGTPQPVATVGAWTADDTFTMTGYYYRTPNFQTLRLKFSGDEVAIEASSSVAAALQLTGRRQE